MYNLYLLEWFVYKKIVLIMIEKFDVMLKIKYMNLSIIIYFSIGVYKFKKLYDISIRSKSSSNESINFTECLLLFVILLLHQ